MNSNAERISEILGYLSIIRDDEGKIQNAKAYKIASNNIKNYGKKHEIYSVDDVKDLKGIGKAMIHNINLILSVPYEEWENYKKTGIPDIDNYPNKEKLFTISTFVKEKGIGPSKAQKSYDEGSRTVQDLIKSNPKNRTLKYSEDLKKRIPRRIIEMWTEDLSYLLEIINEENNTNIQYTTAGSYLRGKETSGDIDIILYSEKDNDVGKYFDDIINYLSEQGYIKTIVTKGNIKCEILAYLPDSDIDYAFQVDFELINNYENYPYALLYFTGSREFNIELKEHAKYLGYKLGSHEMIDNRTEEKVIVSNEREIFSVLNIEYVDPQHRD